jgi:hypothetical protein
MSPDYDRMIAQERKVLASIEEHGEKLVPELKRITASYLREWAIKLLRAYLKGKPEISQGLNPQKSEELKSEFTEILEAIPGRTNQRLDDPQIWLHRVKIPDHDLADLSFSYKFEKRSHNAIEAAIRELIGPVGSLLSEYGFLVINDDLDWEMGSGDIPQYTYKLPSRGIDQFQALDKIRERYKNLLIEYVYASQNLWKAEGAKKLADGDG